MALKRPYEENVLRGYPGDTHVAPLHQRPALAYLELDHGVCAVKIFAGSSTELPAALWDECLSSAAVNRFLINEADLTRAKRAEVVDRAAAAWMLQAALDAGNKASEE